MKSYSNPPHSQTIRTIEIFNRVDETPEYSCGRNDDMINLFGDLQRQFENALRCIDDESESYENESVELNTKNVTVPAVKTTAEVVTNNPSRMKTDIAPVQPRAEVVTPYNRPNTTDNTTCNGDIITNNTYHIYGNVYANYDCRGNSLAATIATPIIGICQSVSDGYTERRDREDEEHRKWLRDFYDANSF